MNKLLQEIANAGLVSPALAVSTPGGSPVGGTPFASSGTWGTCPWEIDENGTLTVRPGTGQDTCGKLPWRAHNQSVKRAVFAADGDARVEAPPTARAYSPAWEGSRRSISRVSTRRR